MLRPNQYKDVTKNTDGHTDASVGHSRPVWTQDFVRLLSHGGAGLTRGTPSHPHGLHAVYGAATCGPGDSHARRVEALTTAYTGVTQATARL